MRLHRYIEYIIDFKERCALSTRIISSTGCAVYKVLWLSVSKLRVHAKKEQFEILPTFAKKKIKLSRLNHSSVAEKNVRTIDLLL